MNFDQKSGEPIDPLTRVTDASGVQWERTRTNWATVRPDGSLRPIPWSRLVAERGPLSYNSRA